MNSSASRKKVAVIRALAAIGALLCAVPSLADDVYLTNGSVFEQVETTTTDTHVVIEMAIGKLTLPLSQVKELRVSDTPIAEFRRRHQSLLEDPSSNASGWLHLSRWGLAHGLHSQATKAALFAAKLDPNLDGLAPLLNGLGYEQLDSIGWIPRPEAMRLQGKVLYDGEWLTTEERTSRIAAETRSEQTRDPRASRQARSASSQRATDDNEVAIASIKLAEKALEQGERSAQREFDRRRDRGQVAFGSNRFGVYPGVVLPHYGAFASPEDAAAYNEQVRKDIANLVSRPPGSIIPVNTGGSRNSGVFANPEQ